MGDYYSGYQSRGYGGGGGGGRGGGRGGGGRGMGDRGGRGGGRSGDRNPGPDYYSNPNAENFCKLFLGGLAPETTEDSLKDHFGTYGTIVDCVVMRDPEKKRSRGFGFVTFEQSSCVTDVQAQRPHKVDGKQIETKRATPKHQQAEGIDAKVSTTKLFVGGVKDEMTDSMFREEFSKYGNVDDVKIIQGKGFAFVTFDDHDAVDFCNLIGRFEIGDKWVNAKKAQEKSRDGGGGRGGFSGDRGGRGGGRSAYGGQGGGYGSGGGGGYGGGYGDSSGYGNDYGNDYSSGGFGSDYQSSYGGGPVKSGGGYGTARSAPYGGSGGGGYGASSYGSQGSYGGSGGGYDSYGSGGGGYQGGGSSYGSGGGGYGGGYQKR